MAKFKPNLSDATIGVYLGTKEAGIIKMSGNSRMFHVKAAAAMGAMDLIQIAMQMGAPGVKITQSEDPVQLQERTKEQATVLYAAQALRLHPARKSQGPVKKAAAKAAKPVKKATAKSKANARG